MTAPETTASDMHGYRRHRVYLPVWRFEDQLGCAAPRDIDVLEVVMVWLHEFEDLHLEDLRNEEVLLLAEATTFVPLFSVVKRDHDHIDPDDRGGWHSDGSGKRVKDAWFIESATFSAVVDAVLARAA